MKRFNNILLTGANGFLGSAILRQAVKEGLSVTATDRSVKSEIQRMNFIAANILDPLSLSKIFDGVDCVCHVAGLAHVFVKSDAMKEQFHAINVVGAQNVALASVKAGVRHFVFISSVSVYGGVAHNQDEDSVCYPEGAYAESKLQAEHCLIELCQKEGMNLTILRLGTLYGEEDPGNVVQLIRAIDRGRFIWIGNGENLKGLLHLDDAARACIAVMTFPISGINIYNVTAQPHKMNDIVKAISYALEKTIPSWHIQVSFALTSIKVMKIISFNSGLFVSIYNTVRKWLADDYYNINKFSKTFNFQAQVSLEEGIRREVDWYRQNNIGKI